MTLQLSQTDIDLDPLDPGDPDVHPLLRQRMSSGSFAADMLAWHQILQLLKAARCAPSSHNSQPWRLIVVMNGLERQVINADLVTWGASWAAKAPVLIAVVTELDKGTTHAGLNYALFDCGLAVQNILLQATSMGLAAHPVGFGNRPLVSRALGLQPHHTLVLFVAVGHHSSDPSSTESSRWRKPLNAIASLGQWDSVLGMDAVQGTGHPWDDLQTRSG
jgi:nitroreductase